MLKYSNLKIKIENQGTVNIVFPYNTFSTFDDLLELIAYYYTQKPICPCFKFRAKDENEETTEIAGNSTVSNTIDKYTNFELFNSNPHQQCICSNIIKENYKKSKLKIIENLSKISETNNKILDNNYILFNKSNSYDLIMDFKSIKDICKGWEIKMSKKLEQNYDFLKKMDVIRLGVLGNINSGKTFLLSKITHFDLPIGIRTQGLSIKYPEDLEEFPNRRIVLLDSCGLKAPLLDDNFNSQEAYDYEEKEKNKLIKEIFLQNYIINNSDILFIVLGILTYSDQKLLDKIKYYLKKLNFKKIVIIIHNLMTFTKIEQVNNYINNVLSKSKTFNLKEGSKLMISNEKMITTFYIEFGEDFNEEQDYDIYHYIMAHEGSEAGKFFNEFTINQINKYYIILRDEPFDIIKSIKKNFIEFSKDIFDNIEESIKLNNFDNTNNKLIKLNKPNNLVFKKWIIDINGYENIYKRGFIPAYNFYEKDDKFIIRIEAPGNCSLSTSYYIKDEHSIIWIEGYKKKDKEPTKIKDNIYSNRKYGNFILKIPLKFNEYNIKNEKPEIYIKNGIIMIEYKILKVENIIEYNIREEDEI